MEQQWEEIRKKLQNSLTRGQYDLWVSTLEFMGVKQGCLLLGCRNRFHIEWLREKLETKMLNIVQQHFPDALRAEYQIIEDAPQEIKEEPRDGARQITFNDLIKRSVFNPRFTFDQFVVGSSNQLAFASSMAMASGQQMYGQSVFLLSDTGLGKSHLSHAVGNYLNSNRPDMRVQLVTAEQFANEMIFSLKHGNIEAFKKKFRSSDVLLLEKIEFLSGKEKIQNELVYTLDELMDRGKQVLCTGAALPRDIPKLNSELQSRLSGTLLASIDRPDFRTRIEIIKRKCRSENLRLPMDVIEYVADRLTGDIRQIESCLVGITVNSNVLGVPITLDLAQDVTQTMLERLPKITVEHIQRIVCSSFQIGIEDLQSPSRKKELAFARKIGMYLCRQYTTESLANIGRSFKRSHSSVVYAINGLGRELEKKSAKLKHQVEFISRQLERSCLSV